MAYKKFGVMLLTFYILLSAPTLFVYASSTLVNGGFETGDLTGWTVGGSASHVEVLTSTNFNPNTDPPEGSFFALLATGQGQVNPAPQGDLDGNGAIDYDTSTLSQTFNLTEESLLSFSWCFLSGETTVPVFDDIFYVELNGTRILTGSVPGGTSPFPDVPPLDGIPYQVSSSGLTHNNYFAEGRTQFQVFNTVLDIGIYHLTFVVADGADPNNDSGLLIDSIEFSPPPPTISDLMEKLDALEAKIDEIEAKLDNETRFTDDAELSDLEDKLTIMLNSILSKLGAVGGLMLPKEELSYILNTISENIEAVTLIVVSAMVFAQLTKRMK